jgi:hypothetical protein
LLECLVAPEDAVAALALQDVGGRVQVLLQCLVAAEGSIAALAFKDMSGRAQMLLKRLFTRESSIAAFVPRHGVMIVGVTAWWWPKASDFGTPPRCFM